MILYMAQAQASCTTRQTDSMFQQLMFQVTITQWSYELIIQITQKMLLSL